jgi:hypothetical protein
MISAAQYISFRDELEKIAGEDVVYYKLMKAIAQRMANMRNLADARKLNVHIQKGESAIGDYWKGRGAKQLMSGRSPPMASWAGSSDRVPNAQERMAAKLVEMLKSRGKK